MEFQRKDVLDNGYVILHETLGSDLTVVNSARVSYNKKKEVFDEKDEKLIKFLVKNDHTSPFRHATMQFEVYCPLFTARQWWKYVIGGSFQMDGWNESSRRYVTGGEEFYIPDCSEWRSAPENKKQGSGENLAVEEGTKWTEKLVEYIKVGHDLYTLALSEDVAPEQARLFLPAYGMYVRFYWTASLQSVAHFLKQRLGHDAQKEIQLYAEAVESLALEKFPISIRSLLA